MPRDTAATRQDLQLSPADFWKWVWASVRPALGWILAGLGFLLLLIAYLGVSREVLVAKQLPYLVSGGLFGLAFVTLGSRLLLIEDLRRDSGRLNRLETMVQDLSLALLSRPDAPLTVEPALGDTYAYDDATATPVPTQGAVPRPSSNGRSAATELLVLRGGSSFHRQTCSVVTGKVADALSATQARTRGLRACRLCQPTAATAELRA